MYCTAPQEPSWNAHPPRPPQIILFRVGALAFAVRPYFAQVSCSDPLMPARNRRAAPDCQKRPLPPPQRPRAQGRRTVLPWLGALGLAATLALAWAWGWRSAEAPPPTADCNTRELTIRRTPLKTILASVRHLPPRQLAALPHFAHAVRCADLDEVAKQAGTAAALREALRCWQDLIRQVALPTAPPSDAKLRLSDGFALPVADFWRMKRPELLRDCSALSRAEARFYEAHRHRLLADPVATEAAVQQQLEGWLRDPWLRCPQHALLAFDQRAGVFAQSMWKGLLELLIALRLLGREAEAEAVFSSAVALPPEGNMQAWHSSLTVHAQLPHVRASPFWDKSEFPWLLRLEQRWEDIRGELLQVQAVAGFTTDMLNTQLSERKQDDWQTMMLYNSFSNQATGRKWWNDVTCQTLTPVTCSLLRDRPELDPDNLRLPPTVAQAAQELNRSRVQGPDAVGGKGFTLFLPELFVKFYFLKPGARLRPHVGTHGRLAAHLGLVVPEGCCSLTVGGQKREWREGEVMVFDDTFVHEAVNEGDKPRVVLAVFFLHPDLLPK